MSEPQYLIWSNQRGMWWRPDERGYTQFIEEAGRYPRGEAERIVAGVTIDGQLVHQRTDPYSGVEYRSYDEVMVPAPEHADSANPQGKPPPDTSWLRTPEVREAGSRADIVDGAEDLRTPDEWQAQPWCDRIVVDPDGWRGGRYGRLSWDTPITRTDYERRAYVSTTMPKVDR